MDLRGRRIDNLTEFWCLVSSGGSAIWVSSIIFQKPQQPLHSLYSPSSSKNFLILMAWSFLAPKWLYWYLFVVLWNGSWKSNFSLIFDTLLSEAVDQRLVLWWLMAVEVVEARELAEADEVNEAAEVSKAWKITTEDFILMFWPIFFLEIWNLLRNFCGLLGVHELF